MQDSMDKDEASGGNPASAVDEHATPGERVFTEPIDDYGIILLETRIAPDGTTRTRYISRKGCPVITPEERESMECPYPPEPDCWA
jgi:hypothetical protein